EDLRRRCKSSFKELGDPEFSLVLEGVMFRVTQMTNVSGSDVFFIRRSQAQIRPIDTLGLADQVIDAWRNPNLRGIVLVAGEMKNGKTSTTAGFVVDRLHRHGGLAMGIEDPPETNLDGLHGKGRCIQVHASRHKGGYEEALIRSMRTGADLIFVGEIRDTPTAVQVLTAGINGHLLVATIHAGSVPEAAQRIVTLASPKMPNAQELLATGLSMVLWQSLHRSTSGAGEASKTITRLKSSSLILTGSDSAAIKAKIRQGQLAELKQDVEIQGRAATWRGGIRRSIRRA
ncbi:ATPase, T2SS/T4P/T4SS family, partial [Pseudomonas sp. JG-B]|uniref:ATPase, T2SS/T4P/T4SS family n=1 Tax=Pseudomonas sp. JG-B TaxID=2603214 RepID=UPI00129E72E1